MLAYRRGVINQVGSNILVHVKTHTNPGLIQIPIASVQVASSGLTGSKILFDLARFIDPI